MEVCNLKTGLKLFLGFSLTAVVITYVSSWVMEYNRYTKRLVSPEEVKKTLEFARTRIEQALALPWMYGSKDEFEDAYKRAMSSIKDEMLPIDAFRIVQPVLSTLNDQNIRLQPPTEPVYRVLPFMVTVVDGRMIVTSTADAQIPIGSEVISISGVSAGQIHKSLLTLTSGEHVALREQQLTTLVWLFPEIFKLKRHPKIDILRLPESHKVMLKIDGNIQEVEVKTTTAFSYPRLVKSAVQVRGPFEFERRGDLGILKLGTFSLKGGMYNRYRDFLNGLFLDHGDLGALIVDLRGSTTHDYLVFQELCEHLIDTAVSVSLRVKVILTAYNLGTLEKVGVDFQRSTGELLERELAFEFKPREPVFSGRVFLLTDRYTSNAAFDFVLLFSKLGRGRILGERPLTGQDHSAEVNFQFVSSLGGVLSYPTLRLSESQKLDFAYERSLSTDERIDYLLGKSDPLLEEAVNYVRSHPALP